MSETVSINPENIEVGDIVYLKIGSNKMMVDDIIGSQAKCVWHDNSGKPQEKLYSLKSLTKKKPNVDTPLGIFTG